MAQDPNVGREILPIPDQPYRGPVPFDARNATAPPQPMLRAPEGAPNVVIVLLDDMGFGIPSAFGGFVKMPTSERLAHDGNFPVVAPLDGLQPSQLRGAKIALIIGAH